MNINIQWRISSYLCNKLFCIRAYVFTMQGIIVTCVQTMFERCGVYKSKHTEVN